jgi:polysaccharide lyase-like protein
MAPPKAVLLRTRLAVIGYSLIAAAAAATAPSAAAPAPEDGMTSTGPVSLRLPAVTATPKFFATFERNPFKTGTGDGTSADGIWWVEQKRGTIRATIVNIARDGATALRLHTEPGDSNVSGSGSHERNDIALPQKTTDCSEGREQVWEHSMLLPDDFVRPPGGWYAVAGFHHSGATGQGNFTVFAQETLRLVGYGGVPGSPRKFDVDGGAITKNRWYDFVYHIKWSAGGGGFFKAWVDGDLKLNYKGPTLYSGMGCYLKLANYHTAFGQPTSVIHDRVIRYDVVR